MRALSLAVRGLWWRRGSSVAIFLLAVVSVAVAAAGPAYLAGGRDGVVQTTLGDAAADAGGTGVSVDRRSIAENPHPDGVVSATADAFADLIREGIFGAPVGSVSGTVRQTRYAENDIVSQLVFRQDQCAHVVIRAGACVADDDPAGVVLTADTASTLGVQLGDALPYTSFAFTNPALGPLRVTGIYEPVDPAGPYWFAATHRYFGVPGATDAVLAPETTWVNAAPDANASLAAFADLRLDATRVDAALLPTLLTALTTATARVQATSAGSSDAPDAVTTELTLTIAKAQLAERSLTVPVAVVTGQLVALTVAVLFLVMMSSAESRAPELTLGKLHGLRPRAAFLHALLEPALVLGAAVPVGVGFCALVLHAVARSAFGPSAHAGFGPETWLAALAAGVGGVLASLLTAVSSLRRPILEQWRRTERRPRARTWVVEAAVVVAALGGAVELTLQPDADSDAAVLTVLSPALLAVAVALLGARVVPLLARVGAAATRGRRQVPVFLALRQTARRRDGIRVFGLLCVTVALLVFGLASQTVFDRNRVDRARADVGAHRVVELVAGSGPDVAATVARLDPTGRDAAAVYQGPITVRSTEAVFDDDGQVIAPVSTPTTAPTMIVVDPARFAAVALWRSDYAGDRSAADVVTTLRRDLPSAATYAGTTLRMTGTVRATAGQDVELRVGLTTNAGAPFTVALGTFAADGASVPFDTTVTTPQCSDGCTLRRLSMFAPASDDRPLVATVDVTRATGGSTPLLPVLAASDWTPLNSPSDGGPVVDDVQGDDGVVRLTVTATGDAFDRAYGFGAVAGLPEQVPGLVTSGLTSVVTGQTVDVEVVTGDDLFVVPEEVEVLPRAGDAGVVVSAAWLAAANPEGYQSFAPDQVWLSPNAPADFPEQLARAGVAVAGVESVSGRAAGLSRQGPAFAVAMLVFGSLAAAVLAVVGTSVTLFVAARRRLFELAALRALGLSPRRMLVSLVVEHATVATAAAAAGLGAGSVGARLALTTVPEFADRPTFPPLLTALPVGRVVVAAAAIALAVGVVTAAGDAVLVRRADVTRLREAQT